MRIIMALVCFVSANICSGQGRSLDYFINAARQNSPTLKDFENQLLSLRIDSQLLKASLGPQVDFNSVNSYAPVINGWGYDEAITNIANISELVKASRTFLSRGNIAAQYRSIALQYRAHLDSMFLSQQDIVRAITDQYITAFSDQLAVDYNKEVWEMMHKEEAVLKKLTESSVYKQTDYLTFYVTLQQQELTWLQAQIQYRNDYLALNYLAGIVDTSLATIEKPLLPDTLNSNLAGTVFYTRFITDSLRLENERELVRYEYKPKIGAYVDGGYLSSLQVTPYRNFGFSAGVSLSIPIYDGHQKQMKLAKVDLRQRTLQSNREFYMNQYRMQVMVWQDQLRQIDNMVNKINKQIGFARTLIVANGKLLETGDITMKDYITAINSFMAAQNLLTQNTVARMKVMAQFNYWNTKTY